MNWFLIIVALLVALILIVLEVVAVPGFTVFGIGGLLLLTYAVYATFSTYGITAGVSVMAGSLAAGVILFAWFVRSKTWKRFKLSKEISGKVNTMDSMELAEGMQGKTLSRLAPTGKAIFGDHKVEVCAVNELIDPGVSIEIIQIDGNKISVKSVISTQNKTTN